jgi:PKD repeat protein
MERSLRILLACLLAAVVPACNEDQPTAAPVLTATCEARPSTGAAPLAVSFQLSVSGAEGAVTVAISYGDGQSGTNPDTPHTYASAGSYTAAFTASTATQTARCSAAVTVTEGASPAKANQPPVPVFKTTPFDVALTITGKAPFTVSFNMCPSSDPEGDELYFEMDFDGDDKFDFKGITGFHCRADYTYAVGTYKGVMNCLYDRDAQHLPLHDEICRTYTVVATP